MSFATVPIGTEIALPTRVSAEIVAKSTTPVKVTGDLLAIYAGLPGRTPQMLKTVCGHLGRYLDLPGDQIPIDLVETKKRGFRQYLESRRYSENTIRTYVGQQRRLLNAAKRHGWDPIGNPAEPWLPLLDLARDERLTEIIRHFANTTKSPKEVTKEAVDKWGDARLRDGLLFTSVASKKNQFWILLKKTGWIDKLPRHLMKFSLYGVPLDEMPAGLRNDVQTLLAWKQAVYAPGRPKKGKIRAVTANGIRLMICQFTGYVINVCGYTPTSFKEILQKHLVEGFVEWAINERGIKGNSIEHRIAQIYAMVKYHPAYVNTDYTWFKPLIDGIPLEDASERKKRKATKFVDYDELEAIPDKIRAEREAYAKRKKKSNARRIAELAQEEFMVRWFSVLPWRQRNMRECRVGGPTPNLFKAKIPPFSEVDKQRWVIEEEAKNSDAQFWQISFAHKGTKTGIPIDLILPHQLIEPLEEFLTEFRPILLNGGNADNLFLNKRGKPMRSDQIGKIIGHWTTKFAPVRTTPHMIRDTVAFKWLKEHPKDFLTLSKMLWHKNIQTTIGIYGSRYNESSGVNAMEAWLDQRASHLN
jgi:integrase